MKIIYYTSGITGSGHIVLGISIGNALRRGGVECEFTILSSSPFARLADRLSIDHKEIPLEDEKQLSPECCFDSALYQTLTSIKPDVFIVDQFWFMVHHFIDKLPCKKIFICRQIEDKTFSINLPYGKITFRPDDYDAALMKEPFESIIKMDRINPVIMRNRDEILSQKAALDKLGIKEKEKVCLFAFNGKAGEFERIKKTYSYLEDVGYRVVYTTNYDGGLFPAVDYFNAFDLVICGAGYNAFWEAIYFKKETVFVPVPRRFESQQKRVNECQEHHFDINGADQLVDIILNL